MMKIINFCRLKYCNNWRKRYQSDEFVREFLYSEERFQFNNIHCVFKQV